MVEVMSRVTNEIRIAGNPTDRTPIEPQWVVIEDLNQRGPKDS